MKTFKEFLAEAKPPYNKWRSKGLSWDRSPLFFDSSFGEHHNRSMFESMIYVDESDVSKSINWFDADHPNKHLHHESIDNEHGVQYNAGIHGHEDYHSRKLTSEERRSVLSYTSAKAHSMNGHAASQNMNGMLRNMSGDKKSAVLGQDPNDVKDSIKKLSSAFRPETTNRKPVTTWGGVPAHIGEQLMNSGQGSQHHIPGFTSTSTSKSVAYKFAFGYNLRKAKTSNDPVHIIQYHLKPGTGLSAAEHSPYDENEFILHHGAKIEYHGSENVTHQENDGDGQMHLIIHHVTVHPEHKSFHEYGEYHHPNT